MNNRLIKRIIRKILYNLEDRIQFEQFDVNETLRNISKLWNNLSKYNNHLDLILSDNIYIKKENIIYLFRKNMIKFLLNGSHENSSSKLILNSIDHNSKVFIDVGANYGYYSILVAKKYNIKVYAFEPGNEAYSYLLKNIALNQLYDNIIPIKMALGNTLKESLISKDLFAKNHIVNEHGNLIRMTTLDSYIKKHNLEALDFIKVDIEGFEPFFIEGAKESIMKYKPMVLMELSKNLLKRYGKKPKDIFNLMDLLDYRCKYVLFDNKIINFENISQNIFNRTCNYFFEPK